MYGEGQNFDKAKYFNENLRESVSSFATLPNSETIYTALDEWRNGKNLQGTRRQLIQPLSRNFPGQTEEYHKKHFRISIHRVETREFSNAEKQKISITHKNSLTAQAFSYLLYMTDTHCDIRRRHGDSGFSPRPSLCFRPFSTSPDPD
jgi:hypothetical protein